MYTIAILKGGTPKRERVLSLLQERLAKDGRFRVNRLTVGEVGAVPAIFLQGVRLSHKKEYCGQHAGECQVNPFTGAPPKKINATYLEYQDWIQFHNVVNSALNRARAHANVWTNPMEGGVRKMWIRKDLSPRVRWDYTTTFDNYGRAVHVWNAGDDSQFQA